MKEDLSQVFKWKCYSSMFKKKKLSPFQHKTTVVSTITKDSVFLVQIKKNPLNHINLYWMGVVMRSQSCLWRQLYPRGLSLYINLTGQQRWFFTFSDFVFLSYNLKIHQFSCCGKKTLHQIYCKRLLPGRWHTTCCSPAQSCRFVSVNQSCGTEGLEQVMWPGIEAVCALAGGWAAWW